MSNSRMSQRFAALAFVGISSVTTGAQTIPLADITMGRTRVLISSDATLGVVVTAATKNPTTMAVATVPRTDVPSWMPAARATLRGELAISRALFGSQGAVVVSHYPEARCDIVVRGAGVGTDDSNDQVVTASGSCAAAGRIVTAIEKAAKSP